MARVGVTPAVVVLAVAAALVWWSMPAAAQLPAEVPTPDVLDGGDDEQSDEEGSGPTEGAADTAAEEAAEVAPAPAPAPTPSSEESPPPPEPQEVGPAEQQPEPQPAPVRGMASGPRLRSLPMPGGPAPAEGAADPVQAPQVADPEGPVPGVSVAPPAEEEQPAAAESDRAAPETTESRDKISVAAGGSSGDEEREAMPTLAVLMALAVGLTWNDRRQRRARRA